MTSEITSLSDWREKRENTSASKSPSKPNITSEKHGQMSIDEDELQAVVNAVNVIFKARVEPFTTKSDFARAAADEVALCASEGFITTRVNDDYYGNVWMVTQLGLEFLEAVEDVLCD